MRRGRAFPWQNLSSSVDINDVGPVSPTGAGVPVRTLRRWISRHCATSPKPSPGTSGFCRGPVIVGFNAPLSERPLRLIGKRSSEDSAALAATASPQISKADTPAKRTYHSRGESLRTAASETAVPKARHGGRREAAMSQATHSEFEQWHLYTPTFPRPSVLYALTPCNWDTVRRELHVM